MPTEPTSAGDAISQDRKIIEVRVGELRQLFNAIDPSPFRERDLDPRAEEFIVGWSKADEAPALRDAIHEFFGQRAAASRRSLRELLRRGRTSLAIGLAFLALSIGIGDALANYIQDSRLADILREGFVIGSGWRCGGRWRSFYTTGGPFEPTLVFSID